jgi:lactoylglutathione lyase
MTTRPFRVLGVQQIAIGGRDRSELRRLWADCLGLASLGTFRSIRENVDEEMLCLGDPPARVEVDLMQPIDPSAKPDVSSPALNHVGLWIDRLPAAVGWLCCRGVRIARGGIRRGASGHDVCFIHPKPSRYFPISGSGALI